MTFQILIIDLNSCISKMFFFLTIYNISKAYNINFTIWRCLFYFFYKNILSNRYLLFIFLNYPTKSLYKFISILNIFQYFEHIFLENLFLYLVVYARKPLFYETFIVPNCKKETQTYDLRVMRCA